jgi:hypothetical protein
MRIAAFAGPSLRARDRLEFPDIDWHPPAEAGDLLRLQTDEVSTVCLIDGYFDHRPAVRHKEILLLLSQGVRIFGASSIGALRAAEMQAMSMIGIGAIFQAFARGTIWGDDEVALIHAGADRDWNPLSIPLADVRATLCAARRKQVIDRESARALLIAARSIHYTDRDWKSVCATAVGGASDPHFENWVEQGAVEQKRIDAIACMRAVIAGKPMLGPRPEPVITSYLVQLAGECDVDLVPAWGKQSPEGRSHLTSIRK